MNNVIRSFDQGAYTYDELDREILRAIREVMIQHDLWENFHEGTFEEVVNPNGSLYVDPYNDDESCLSFDREEISAFTRELVDILFSNLSISLMEDVEQGMIYLYRYEDDHDTMCGCSDAYCGV